MKNSRFYVRILLSITLSGLFAQSTVPDWFTNPVSDDNYFYGIGVSDINGSIEERKAQSIKRAVVNLALLRECRIKSIDKSFTVDNSETIEVVVQLDNQALFDLDDIEVNRRWREEDGHVYTEVKSRRSFSPGNQNAIVIKYYYSESSGEGSDNNVSLSLQMSAKWSKDRLWESVVKSPGESYSYDNLYVEYMPEFNQWFGKTTKPDWYSDICSDKHIINAAGYGENGNLHVAVMLACISVIKELSLMVGEQEQILAETFRGTDNTDDQSVISSINTRELKNIIPRKISVGISDDQNFIVYS